MQREYVLTGGPGSGKSSIILALEADGQAVVREAAEDVIKLMQARGIAEPWKQADFQNRILDLQHLRELHMSRTEGTLFIDRGTLDGLAYYNLQGVEPSGMMRREIENYEFAARGMYGMQKRYEKVFLIESLGSCKRSAVRRENLMEAKELERLQAMNYVKMGYEIIRIAPGTVDERVTKILDSTK